MNLPLPSGLSARLGREDELTSRSLLFDKGMCREEKHFLKDFVQIFARAGYRDAYDAFMKRRRVSLCGASVLRLKASQRLVVGLGLPHPTETGLLLDRLNGVPYIPGSSVKGLLRAAAKLTAEGSIPNDAREYWNRESIGRVFGQQNQAGAVIFFDAYPTTWPELELDIMTPHYGKYYMEGAVPADWYNPTPVQFLTVKAGTAFRFWFRNIVKYKGSTEDAKQVKDLLPIALDWLGIGAKKSAGYGTFER